MELFSAHRGAFYDEVSGHAVVFCNDGEPDKNLENLSAELDVLDAASDGYSLVMLVEADDDITYLTNLTWLSWRRIKGIEEDYPGFRSFEYVQRSIADSVLCA